MQEYDFEIAHRKGKANGNADGLSRLQVETIGSQDLGLTQVQAAQTQDPTMHAIIRRIRNGDVVEDYSVHQGLLYRNKRLCIPVSLRQSAIALCHEGGEAGHPGVWKTERRLSQRFDIGVGVLAAVRKFIKNCPVCQKRKPGRSKVGDLIPIAPPARPFEKIGLDFMGPLNAPGHAALFVLVVVDYCTRFVQLFPSRRISTTAVLRALETVQNTYGRVQEVITDNGSCSRSRRVTEFMAQHQIQHRRTAIGHPQTNGLTERTIRTVTERIGSLIVEGKTAIQRMLPRVAFSLNTTASESLGTSPFELLYGFSAVLPGEPAPHPELDRPAPAVLREEAHQRLARAQEKMQARFERQSVPPETYDAGDQVLIRVKQTQRGLSAKLHPRFQGPHSIVRRVAPQTYEVQSRAGRKRILNVKDLRLHARARADG